MKITCDNNQGLTIIKCSEVWKKSKYIDILHIWTDIGLGVKGYECKNIQSKSTVVLMYNPWIIHGLTYPNRRCGLGICGGISTQSAVLSYVLCI